MEQQTDEVFFLPDGKKGDPGEQESCSLLAPKSKSLEYSELRVDRGIETVEILENVQGFPDSDKEVPTYSNLIMSNRPFRLYLASYLIATAGEWFTYVASIELLEELLGSERSTSRRYVSCILVCRLIPSFFLIPFGGILADVRDRRHSMIMLDLLGAITPLLYLLASYYRSIELIYVVTLLQAIIASFYEPCRSSILPLMVKEEENLRMATTLTGMAWSVMTQVGSGLGGLIVAEYGITSCFILDSATFIISAMFMFMVEGEWDASAASDAKEQTMWERIEDMSVNGLKYIFNSKFWPIVFFKMTTSLVYGGGDILNVSFAEEDPLSTTAEQSTKLGALFFCVGLGCMLGPLVFEPFTNMDNPITVLNACVLGFGLQAIGSIGVGYFQPFSFTLLSTIIRAMGSSITWIDSQVLIQMVVTSDMLGRVVAIDYGLALAAEAFSAVVAALLQDRYNVSPREVSMMMGGEAIFFLVLWFCYRIFKSDAIFIEAQGEQSESSTDEETTGDPIHDKRAASEQTPLVKL